MQRSEPASLKDFIVARARELGVSSVRFAPAFIDDASRERMKQAFARGDFATWSYDERYAADASDPAHVLAGARTVVCFAFPYATELPARAPLQGRVSNYAWSQDYHRRVRAVLAELAADIDARAGASVTAIACDTKPIAERAFAARSGLGWIGKHTNLISPQAGSFIFLGEIVTTLDFDADAPVRKTCGSCARCVDACPTGALRGDYTIDATRCIADLTQRTDAIPREMRALIGDWIWGCDICQIVCPPTARAGLQGDASAQPRDGESAAPSLVALLRLRSGEFKRRFAPTAMGWRGAAVLRRNAAVALGNALDRSAIAPLAQSLREDPHPMVRAHAAWALGRIGAPRAREALRKSLETESDASVGEEIRAALEPRLASTSLGGA
ncbi:MAG: tRNA epoxyqueuosine(34) reductase QueG [Candidatus Baltobacteraceae bacterium]